MKPTHYNVRPRYTCGSPGMVDQKTAEQVAKQEQQAFVAYKEGVYGEPERLQAEAFGLDWIAYGVVEKGKYLYKMDLISGKWLTIEINKALNMIPVYASDMKDAFQVQTNLKNIGLKFQTWVETSADHLTNRTLLVVREDDLEKACSIITRFLHLTPMPQYFRRKVQP